MMRIACFLLLLIFGFPALAQDHFVFSSIDANNGLSDNQVRSLCQLPDGRMVVITESFVNLYNGADFRYFHFNEQISYKLSKYTGWHHAYVGADGQIWIKYYQKLSLLDVNRETYIANIDSVLGYQEEKNGVADFFMDNAKNIWFVTNRDELVYRNVQERKNIPFLSNISALNGKPDPLYDLATLENQAFLFFKSGEMVCYDIARKTELYRENPYNGANKYDGSLMVISFGHYIYQLRNGGGGGQLLRFNVQNRQWQNVLETDYTLNTLTIDNQGNCWVSSGRGLWMADQSLQRRQMIPQLQMVDGRRFRTEIATQFNDNSGGLWIGTINRGLLYYHRDRFKFRNFGNALFEGKTNENINVSCVAADARYTFAGTQSGLFYAAKGDSSLKLLPGIPENTRCNALFRDNQQNIWLCSNVGLFRLQGRQITRFEPPFNCQGMAQLFNGKLFVYGSGGLARFNPSSGKFQQVASPSGKNTLRITQMIPLIQSTLLGISDAGLFYFDSPTETFTFIQQDKKLAFSNPRLNCVFADSRGLIWIGTSDGLNIYNERTKELKTVYAENGLVNNSIRSVTEDENGRIWVSTANGISRIDVAGKEGSYQYSFSNFNKFDGVLEAEFLARSVHKTQDNKLLWGGIDGFNELDLERTDAAFASIHAPLFTGLSVAGTEVKLGEQTSGNTILSHSISSTKTIELKHFQNFISFRFSALNYINPTQTFYRYQLEGIDDGWQEIKPQDGTGQISYTNLPAGTYKLKIFAANNSRRWSQNPAEMTVIIKPPFWKTGWAYLLYILMFGAIAYFAFSAYIRKNRIRVVRRQKEELDQMKFTFFTNISHELRTPLTLILTPLESILKKMDEGTLKSQLNGIHRNANNLLNLVNQILDFRKLETSGETLKLSYCEVNEFVEAVLQPFFELAKEQQIDLNFDGNAAEIYAYVDKDKLHKILNNLLSNAFKFTPKGGSIKLKLSHSSEEKAIQIELSDTGYGIPEADLPFVFDRFYQAKTQGAANPGSGLGLHLVKEYSSLHGGTVKAASNEEQGSVFVVTIPSNLGQVGQKETMPETAEKKNKLSLLIVEDNLEFRSFLVDELSEKYNLIVASNGREGLEKAHAQQPELIITDLMMPEMSGIELCRHLKKDLEVSHIPVIVLTAKTSDQSQIEGFEAGADAYITKPFNMDILLVRIANLLEQQEQRKASFRKTVEITPETLATNTVDQELIKKVLAHIERNLDNPAYSVEQLSKNMFMDRTGLYRKLVAIVGQTPTEFMRSVRMKKAAQLLERGLSVSEVAEQVGFSGTSSYFSKCFQEEFGVKPSQYKKQPQTK